ncbi:L,D-transpeptidase family protein [Hansschlegelia sp.]|uniref:L,D-transpeptidase family protein n=1 Tax=Hansschlegelia sp. TaxID=2041892 RepID=UPI002BA111D5|nr:L,D-transpeptidase family protein [Hansschlegelia sp.]HVI28557.1 L,D-transpeptidase family protein [Hansschlegelia sp.]
MTERPSMIAATRRQALRFGLGAAAAGVIAGPAAAQELFGQAEWKDRFDASAGGAATRTSASRIPTLSPQTAQATERAIEDYNAIVSRGGWAQVPNGPRLKLGSQGERVVALRQRLMASGDLDPNLSMSSTFDSYVEGAVRRFQARHGLIPVGVVGDDTMTSLNIPAETRLRQLQTNLVRIRTMSNGNLGDRYVMANIPAAEAEAVEGDQVVARYTTVAGKVDRASPVLDAKILQVNFNPYWTVPASIVKKDLIPHMQKDPQYLTKNHIRIYDQARNELQPEQVNWFSDEATNYMFREDPGETNSLGTVRLNMANKYGVYMHDTPSKNLFGGNDRFQSSGCMRVQNVKELVAWLLKNDPKWDRRAIAAAIKSGERIDVQVNPNVPVYWRYISGWGAADGSVQFREDIYGMDGTGELAMAGGGASAATGQ